jgi:antitoxin ParD1/3/4
VAGAGVVNFIELFLHRVTFDEKESAMTAESVNVRITGPLREHLQQQLAPQGLYENASEYVRDLIRRDLRTRQDALAWLQNELEPALQTHPSDYIEVSAEDVIARNTRR